MIRMPPCCRPKCGRTRPSASTIGRSRLRFRCESTTTFLPGCDRKARDISAGSTAFYASEWNRRPGAEAPAGSLAVFSPRWGLLHHDINQLVGDGDQFDHLLPGEEGLDLFVSQRACFELLLSRAEGGGNAAAELAVDLRSEEHTSELQSLRHLV